MITKVIQGDAIEIFKSGEFDAFAHGCNCFCTMGKGIAAQVKKELNPLYQADILNGKKGLRKKLGTFSFHEFEFGIGINLYTQYTFWNKKDMLDYEAVENCFKSLNEWMKQRKLKTLVIPKIGAGLAHGQWDVISKLIDINTRDIDVTVVEFKYG